VVLYAFTKPNVVGQPAAHGQMVTSTASFGVNWFKRRSSSLFIQLQQRPLIAESFSAIVAGLFGRCFRMRHKGYLAYDKAIGQFLGAG